MIDKYEKYLEIITPSFNKFFNQQKDYICCKEGCSICCETGTYPITKLEFDYIMLGYEKLDNDQKECIKKNIELLKHEKKKAGNKTFFHACPFLVNKKCSIYNHRALICRSYGLMSYYKDKDGVQRYKIPCCVDQGLNYSKVYDKDLKTITTKAWKDTGIDVEPVSFNVDLSYLLNNEITQDLGLEFGEPEVMAYWFD